MPSLKIIRSLQGFIAAVPGYVLRQTSWWIKVCALAIVCTSAALASSAQTFTTLWNFDIVGAYGAYPIYVSLVQGLDGDLYGTTFYGGAHEVNGNGGTVFKIVPDGNLTTVYSFCALTNCADGEGPSTGLVLGEDGNLYGTTRDGGTANSANCFEGNCGTVFKVTPEGVLTTLHSFTGADDGSAPLSALIQSVDGSFYGTTSTGGEDAQGTIFRITPGGLLTTLHDFSYDQDYVSNGTLLQASDGNFYGTTEYGGSSFFGTVFKLTPGGAYTTLYNFCSLDQCADGRYPEAGLIQGTDGNLYGTTVFGGLSMNCQGGAECGTVFKITLEGVLTVLYSFDGSDGYYPEEQLIQATDGNFYGMTLGGGTGTCVFDTGVPGCGTIFEVTPSGALTTLYYFTQSEGGGSNGAGLLQATNGILYSTTAYGGIYEEGTVFSLNVGLGQFVETNPASGKVGAAVKILGSFLTGATSVTFNGTPATFSINSKSEITTTVPTGATTGTVQVITPRLGMLSSNVPFRVK
jgi:uncharacterized repeat protein (TIGR03803 family)